MWRSFGGVLAECWRGLPAMKIVMKFPMQTRSGEFSSPVAHRRRRGASLPLRERAGLRGPTSTVVPVGPLTPTLSLKGRASSGLSSGLSSALCAKCDCPGFTCHQVERARHEPCDLSAGDGSAGIAGISQCRIRRMQRRGAAVRKANRQSQRCGAAIRKVNRRSQRCGAAIRKVNRRSYAASMSPRRFARALIQIKVTPAFLCLFVAWQRRQRETRNDDR
jgi:hypothetical protein